MTSNSMSQRGSPVGNARFSNDRIIAHAFQSIATPKRTPSAPDSDVLQLDDVPDPGPSPARLLTPPQLASAATSSDQRLQSVLRLLPVGVILLNERGLIDYCNQAAEELLGSTLDGCSWRQVIADKFQPRHDDGHEISLNDGRRVSLSTRSLDGHRGQLIVLNDLTATRDLQQQLSRHQRLSAMGRMVSSLAHQIRTPLSAALLYADKLSKSDSTTASNFASKILSRLHNIDRQIRDMLVFARGDTELRDLLAVSELEQQFQDLTADIPNHNQVDITWHLTRANQKLHCNKDALLGAMTNLYENALQASQPRQSIVIGFEVLAGGGKQDSRLRCRIEDEGCGIDQSLLESLEEPFVTTKRNGTGLGLAVVKQVTRAHDGSFTLLRRAGHGMCAELVLPVAKGEET